MEGVVVPHLGHALRKRRLDENVKLIRVAYLLNRAEATLSRFELGKVQPADIDAVVLAYARELGINPLELWADALELATSEGVSDEFDEPTSAEQTGKAAEALERLGQEVRQRGQKRTAARKRAS